MPYEIWILYIISNGYKAHSLIWEWISIREHANSQKCKIKQSVRQPQYK